MIRAVRTLRRDESGAAMVEFALLFPFMCLLLLGTVQLVQASEAQRRLTHVASAIADLVAQDDQVTRGELDDIMTVGRMLMDPLPPGDLTEQVASITIDQNGRPVTAWSYPTPDMPPPQVPNGYLTPGSSVIYAEASYEYAVPLSDVPLLSDLLPAKLALHKRAFLRPRLTPQVTRTN